MVYLWKILHTLTLLLLAGVQRGRILLLLANFESLSSKYIIEWGAKR